MTESSLIKLSSELAPFHQFREFAVQGHQSPFAILLPDQATQGTEDLETLFNRALQFHHAKDYKQAVPRYEELCNRGHGPGCANLGVLYAKGTGVDLDLRKAAALYEKGCEAGDAPTGCSNLAVLYENGTGLSRDLAKALTLYTGACDGGSSNECSVAHTGDQINSGSGRMASASGAAPGVPKVSPPPATSDNQSNLFDQAMQFDSEENYKQAAQFYQKPCDAGYSKACARPGALYEHGRGVERDMSRAAALYARGCDKDNAEVCTGLGYQYENGVGIGKDPTKAAIYYEKGCDAADGAACNNLGTLYERGLGVAADIKKAATYYEKGGMILPSKLGLWLQQPGPATSKGHRGGGARPWQSGNQFCEGLRRRCSPKLLQLGGGILVRIRHTCGPC